jgi:putative Mn2+ efflux pump MntP
MNSFQIAILALALLFNSWMPYLNAGIVLSGEPLISKIKYAGIMFVIQFCMTGAGVWVGYKAGSLEVTTNMTISLSILLIVGLKVLLTGIKMPTQEKAFDYVDNKVTLIAALAEGITPLFVGTAIGLLSLHPYTHWFLIGGLLLVGIIAGLAMVSGIGSNSLKLRLGPIGGLLMIAASIKMIISLSGY